MFVRATYPLFAILSALAVGLISVPASAQSSARLANGDGMDLHLFRPAVDTRGHFMVNGTSIMPANRVGFGLILDVGGNIAQFDGVRLEGQVPEELRADHVVNLGLTGTLMANVGIANWAVVGIQIPIQVFDGDPIALAAGDGSNGNYVACCNGSGDPLGLTAQGIGDISIHGKLRFLRAERDPLGLAVIARIGIPTGNSRRFSGEPGVSIWPSIVAEFQTAPDEAMRNAPRVRVSIEAGYRAVFGTGSILNLYGRTEDVNPPNGGSDFATVIDPGTNVEYDDLLTFGLGASFRLARPLDLTMELNGTQIADSLGDDGALSLEAMLGFKLFVQEHSYLVFGGGLGIPTAGSGNRGFQAAQWRAMLGFIYEPPVGDRDGDGIYDDIDECPDDPEDFDDYLDEDGCPELDNDGDGIEDSFDACPMIPEDHDGDEDEDGCPEGNESDRDGDGILDDDDECPDEPEDRDGFEDQDGCPELDNDEDGIPDTEDLCPNDAEDIDAFEDEDGCPDLDNDGDHIPDVDDQCPDEPEFYNNIDDEDGCPDEGGIILDESSIRTLDKIYFDTNSAHIQQRSHAILDAVAATLIGNTQITLVEVQGHADERGNDNYNLRLTQDRAAAVVEALVQRGVTRDRLRSAGYGERCPINPASTRAAYDENRRVEFKIIETEDGPTNVEVSCPAGADLVPD